MQRLRVALEHKYQLIKALAEVLLRWYRACGRCSFRQINFQQCKHVLVKNSRGHTASRHVSTSGQAQVVPSASLSFAIIISILDTTQPRLDHANVPLVLPLGLQVSIHHVGEGHALAVVECNIDVFILRRRDMKQVWGFDEETTI